MTSKVFCLASPKGGSGKTIITANFASFLTALGKKCLIIDCDSATHGLTLLYMQEIHKKASESQPALSSGIFDNPHFSKSRDVVQVENGVDFFPATFRFKTLEEFGEKEFSAKLKDVIDQSKYSYDYIFLDAQAGSDAISRAAMSKEISDQVIIVSEYDPLSAAGIERLKSVVGEDLMFDRTWILLNKMLPEFVDKFSEFLSVTKYLTPIPWNADVVRAYSRKKLAIDTEFGNEYTLSIMQSLKTLLGESVAAEIESWASERASLLRQPIRTQYKDAERELLGLMAGREELVSKQIQARYFSKVLRLTPAIAGLIVGLGLISIMDISAFLDVFDRLDAVSLAASTLALSSVAFAILFSPKFERIFKLKNSIELDFEKEKFERKIQSLSERLKLLEAMDKSDTSTIIKQGGKLQE